MHVQVLQTLPTTTNSVIVVTHFMLFTFCYCKENVQSILDVAWLQYVTYDLVLRWDSWSFSGVDFLQPQLFFFSWGRFHTATTPSACCQTSWSWSDRAGLQATNNSNKLNIRYKHFTRCCIVSWKTNLSLCTSIIIMCIVCTPASSPRPFSISPQTCWWKAEFRDSYVTVN